jgi:hypothetical protein
LLGLPSTLGKLILVRDGILLFCGKNEHEACIEHTMPCLSSRASPP